ncbi:ERF family protein [Ochrobactrum chromiisoli]|uniref:ERF family protein n=1 Tax=Ochrobactrum chromiisoli TaxID=2993941 RepID=A0ABT3QUR5_9HYPH|nr:ERF family protein [Ochrobactrum chromiisoli]MCX2699361.1 ERF family protein [Ochrobactrum chromiisoli]
MAAQALDIKQESNAPVYRGGDAPMISMIERIAMDPTIPLDRLEKMLDMKERMEDRAREQMREDREYEAKSAYFAAMSACQTELPVVIKNQSNTHTRSKYADLAAIEEQAMPVIYGHGFGVSFQPDGYNDLGELLIKWEISHSGGYVRNGVGAIPVDGAGAKGGVNKTGTQAFGSTATYGRRYLLCMLFNISTGDDKDGNKLPEQSGPITAEQVVLLRELIEKSGAQIDLVCEKYKIDAIPDLPSNLFNECFRDIENWWKRQQKSNGGAK